MNWKSIGTITGWLFIYLITLGVILISTPPDSWGITAGVVTAGLVIILLLVESLRWVWRKISR